MPVLASQYSYRQLGDYLPLGRFQWSQTGTAPDVTVFEPDLSVDKSLTSLSRDAGNAITVTVIIRHDHTVYDVNPITCIEGCTSRLALPTLPVHFPRYVGRTLTWDESSASLLKQI